MYRPLGAVVITAMAVMAVMPSAASAAPWEVDNIAHRGGSAYAPENTIVACTVARTQRATMCEFDVQATKDHRLILMHDPTLARTTNVEQVFPGRSPWRVSDFTLAEIQRLDAGSWFSARFKGEGVPTLEQGLRALSRSQVGLLLEIKHDPTNPDIDKRVVAELRKYRSLWSGKRLAVQAFNWESMRSLHSMMPDLPISLLGKPAADRLAELAEFADAVTVPHAGLTATYVKQVHEQGMRVYTWTTDRRPVIRRLMSYGVDGIMTERPDSLDAVKRRAMRMVMRAGGGLL
ncbi:glycerophosphodiester phosphodiesterase family protein [Nonomuraea sp. NPDC005650]|uniref:glycerophosphodiester phosphodiesterase n=1 Tax=Nonomuraea sp. NPDC005650 TaxID=3157045 RepID=UPI0033B78482